MTRVLVLTRYGRLGASSRQRFFLYLDELEAAGISADVCPFLGDDYVRAVHSGRAISIFAIIRSYAARLMVLLQTRRYDSLWIEKEALPWIPAWVELTLSKMIGTRIVVDYDDAIFHAYDQHRSRFVRWLLGCKIARIMSNADLVIVGNAYLGRHAKAAGARTIAEIPTVVDLRHYPERRAVPAGHDGRFTLGWVGSSLTSSYLEMLRPALAELMARLPFRIILVGAAPTALAGFPVERVAWSPETEAAELARFNVGLMPLPDMPWERGKCGYKLIQYMASSLPVVASPVGANREIVVPGETGFLAATDADWISSLFRLSEDPELRRRMGAAGRRRASEHYSSQATASRIIDVFHDLQVPSSRRAKSRVTVPELPVGAVTTGGRAEVPRLGEMCQRPPPAR